ncbi:NUDIX hydrolase [Magnetospirillum moscoviense]|uniref:DNA mismatch repair protein MutT n=1 Tax=Magnetospirillum moscoviense TaxID=1437059 RepID=A0A178MZA6_9PROT|nr:DUF4743 domain-containing protein [Magnetospirillum moscoviense]OAN65754.1 DNA mismatch repair protein MutT [Magnetospirillum moscoviense]
MSFLDHIRACNAHDPRPFRPFLCGATRIGRIRHDVAAWLAGFPDIFVVDDQGVRLHPGLDSGPPRSAAIDAVALELRHRYGTPALRGERYRVGAGWGQTEMFTIDRGLVSLFGIRAYGVHVNGFVRTPDGLRLWVAKRALGRPVAPGKLDNLIAGGQPAHLSLMDNLVKEAAEEANVPEPLARTALPVGAISYCLDDEWGAKPDTMFCYDLELPPGFVPVNTDGEVESFALMAPSEAAARIKAGGDFKFNVNLVVTDFLIRHGFLNPDDEPDYVEIVSGLRVFHSE